ncbi:tRNA 2-thiouridine(34) synthase MnmA [Candidatus Peregrinibacteria bacterium]|nr:tRNA 2-thiouridine(34) synthase MnmA [Candidatus Peregrinibacteria bacterium]
MKIAMLISGGVDSSVALRLLKEQGHDLTAFYLKIWLEDELAYLGQCPWKEDLTYVRQICREAGVPLEVMDMQKDYWDTVVRYTIDECQAGRTPNPDIFCNQRVKFGTFYKKIDNSFEKVATGHYAQVEEKDGVFFLKKAPDPVKDQTYFLSHLNQAQLSRALFPIGHLKKSEVRELAKKYQLPNQDRKDSQGICFLGKIPYREFIKEHLGEQPGDFIEKETGKKLGEHKGHWFYTIGQRFGLGLSGGPWFVVKKDSEKNLIYLAQGYDPESVYGDEFEVVNMNWIVPNDQFPMTNDQLQVKIRHGASSHPCTVRVNKNCVQVTLKKPVHGIAPGQFAVFYEGDYCLGGGMIT